MTHLAPEGGNEALTPGRSEEFNFENADGITLSGRLELPDAPVGNAGQVALIWLNQEVPLWKIRNRGISGELT